MKPALLRPALPGLALCASLLLSACTTPYSEAPVATNFPSSKQNKLQAGAHWDAIAKDAANSLVTSMRLGKGCIPAYPDCNQLVLRPPKEPTEFARGFQTLLTTALVNHGVQVVPYGMARPAPQAVAAPLPMPVMTPQAAAVKRVKVKDKKGKTRYVTVTQAPAAAPMTLLPPPRPAPLHELEVDIQVVKFSPDRLDGRYFISGTAVTAGVWGLHGLWTQTSPQGLATGVALGMVFDAQRWFSSEFARGKVPQLEMIVTVSALTNGQYVGRVSNIYYLADSDMGLYAPPAAPPAVRVNGGL